MKIRIKGPSVRMRLSRTEVATLVHEGRVVDETPFGNRTFRYELQKAATGDALTATFTDDTITMYVPHHLVHNWDNNALVTIDAHMPIGKDESLYLLLEKDFQCLDKTTEDQSDNYISPNQTC